MAGMTLGGQQILQPNGNAGTVWQENAARTPLMTSTVGDVYRNTYARKRPTRDPKSAANAAEAEAKRRRATPIQTATQGVEQAQMNTPAPLMQSAPVWNQPPAQPAQPTQPAAEWNAPIVQSQPQQQGEPAPTPNDWRGFPIWSPEFQTGLDAANAGQAQTRNIPSSRDPIPDFQRPPETLTQTPAQTQPVTLNIPPRRRPGAPPTTGIPRFMGANGADNGVGGYGRFPEIQDA